MANIYDDIAEGKETSSSVNVYDEIASGAPSPKSTKKEPGLLERGRKVFTEAGVGGLAGLFAPEILTGLGATASAFPATAPLGPPLFRAGQASRGIRGRLGTGTAGAFGGAVGETSGQAAEAAGYSYPVEEAARFVGGMAGPSIIAEPARLLTNRFGYGLASLINRGTGLPIGTGLRTIGQIASEKGVKELNLTAQQQQFINDKLTAIRGGAESFQPAKDVFAMLRQGADSVLRQAETQSADLQRQANDLIAQAEAQAGPASKDLAFKISRLQSQYNAGADKIRSAAEIEANKLRDQAKKLAQAVQEKSSTQAPAIRAQADKEATAILTTADQEANKIVSDARERVVRMQGIRDRLGESAKGRAATVQEKTGAVGEKRKPSELGASIRKFFDDEFTRLKGIREGNVQKLKTAAFEAAAAKERGGARYQQTQAYGEAISGISNLIKDSETGLLNVGPDELKGLTSIRDVIKRGVAKRSKDEAGNETVTYTPLSFQALENMRRQLRDRAFGLPAEGYDAIGQQRAGDLATYIENIQKEFGPGFEKYLEQYKADSQPLNEFKSKLGQAIIGKSESDFGKFAIDEFDLAEKAFYSAGSVDQLIKTAGEKQAEQLARSFIASRIKSGSPKEILSTIQNKNISDWIGKFPRLEKELNTLAQEAGIVERVAKKRSKLSETLRTEIGKSPISVSTKEAERLAKRTMEKAETAAGKLERQAEELPPRIQERGERAAERVMGRAEQQISAGSKDVSGQAAKLKTEAADVQAALEAEAKKRATPLTEQAGEITKEAKKKADLILGTAYDFERVSNFLLNGSAEDWAVISPIIANTPGGKQKLASAVGQVIADRANQSLKGAIFDMRKLATKLADNNLMPKSEADKLIGKLEEVFVMPIDEATRTTFTDRLIRNAILGYGYPAIERAGEATGEATR